MQSTREKYEKFAGFIKNPTYIRDLIEGRTVSSCPKVKVNVFTVGKELECLLDSGSEVSLVTQNYFEKEILPKLGETDKMQMEVHNYFRLSAANDSVIQITAYVELDIEFECFLITNVCFFGCKRSYDSFGQEEEVENTWCNLL